MANLTLLLDLASAHRLAFIPGNISLKVLTSNKTLLKVALMQAYQRGDVSSVQILLANVTMLLTGVKATLFFMSQLVRFYLMLSRTCFKMVRR